MPSEATTMNLSLGFRVRTDTSGMGRTPSSSRMVSPRERLIARPGKQAWFGGSHTFGWKKTRAGPRSSSTVDACSTEITCSCSSSSPMYTMPTTPPMLSILFRSSGLSGFWSCDICAGMILLPQPALATMARQSPTFATTTLRALSSPQTKTRIPVLPERRESNFCALTSSCSAWSEVSRSVCTVDTCSPSPAASAAFTVAASDPEIFSARNWETSWPYFPWPSKIAKRLLLFPTLPAKTES
mmetsp:Transcript_12303/g.29389  ORF Transcript_12303/g.29389 Transcript_12303/m.29389 type:complete len:242 (-) Transcript_12303:642-1367(-)